MIWKSSANYLNKILILHANTSVTSATLLKKYVDTYFYLFSSKLYKSRKPIQWLLRVEINKNVKHLIQNILQKTDKKL